MNDQRDGASGVNPLARRADAFAALFCSLAWSFSYPDQAQAQTFTSLEFLNACETLLKNASLQDAELVGAAAHFKEATRAEKEKSAQLLRREYTRLFITPPRLIRLEGSHWVKRSRTLVSKRKGERFAVEQQYRELGLANQVGVKDPADHVVSELDFVAYISAAEARAWEGDDAASAREWKLVRDEFMGSHLAEFALGVSAEIERLSPNAHVLFYASMLRAVVSACL